MSYDQLTTKKLFVGGLSNDVTQEMLTKKFKTFGKVASVDIHKKKSLTDDSTNVFAFVCLNATLQNINKCIRTYNDSVWNGRTMRLQIARENFLDRLAAERKDNSIVKEWSLNNNNNNKSNNNNNKKTSVTINDKTSNKVLKYVSSEDDSDSDEESEPGNNDATSSDDDDSSDEEQRGGARMKETNHKSERSGVDPKADKASKKRKADDDDSDDADEDEESDEEMSNKKIKLESQEDMLAEKKKNLEILTSVVGGKKSEKRKLPSTFSSQNSSMQRYDPSKPGHEEFEVREEEEDDDGMTCEPIAKKAKMKADDDDDDSSSDEEDDDDDEAKETNNKQTTQTSATLTTSDVKQFAEVSSTVVDAFKKSEEFKLSSLFGNDEDDEDEEDGDHTVAQPPAKRPKLMTDMFGWDKEDVEDEESDDNDRSDDEGKMVKKRKKKLKVEDTGKKAGGKIKKTVAGKSGKFFFMANDPRLSEGNTFYRTDDLEELRKKWEELRPQYVDSYRLRKRRYRMGKSRM